jgi:hypothetical protein
MCGEDKESLMLSMAVLRLTTRLLKIKRCLFVQETTRLCAPTAVLKSNGRDSNVERIPTENDNIVTVPNIVIRSADTVT